MAVVDTSGRYEQIVPANYPPSAGDTQELPRDEKEGVEQESYKQIPDPNEQCLTVKQAKELADILRYTIARSRVFIKEPCSMFNI
tara:strand:- start:1284 stop:1538 length:255 start_codon:yes stop_codon:yes gene_type:complete